MKIATMMLVHIFEVSTIRWKEYFDGLLNASESGQAEITARPGMSVRVTEKSYTDISMKEVVGAVSRLENGKESGVDDVKAECLKKWWE